MRPALKALAEQQRQIDGLTRWAKTQHDATQALARGLQTVAALGGVEDRVVAAMLKQADIQNPAQPVPEPPAQPATQSTQDAKTPEAFADVQRPGLVPGSTNDVAADATTTVYTPGQDVPVSPFRQLVDVTTPVDGTQSPRPLGEVKTETDVRVGDPMNPNTAFPLQGGFQQAQRTSSKQAVDERGERMMASQRLARLQIQAGIADGDDLALGAEIERDPVRTLALIKTEIATLESVQKAASTRQRVPQRLVPRVAGATRSTPSMASGPSMPRTAAVGQPDDSDLFD